MLSHATEMAKNTGRDEPHGSLTPRQQEHVHGRDESVHERNVAERDRERVHDNGTQQRKR
jgi:hypothetical protein